MRKFWFSKSSRLFSMRMLLSCWKRDSRWKSACVGTGRTIGGGVPHACVCVCVCVGKCVGVPACGWLCADVGGWVGCLCVCVCACTRDFVSEERLKVEQRLCRHRQDQRGRCAPYLCERERERGRAGDYGSSLRFTSTYSKSVVLCVWVYT